MRNSSSLDWLRFMHTPNDYRVSQLQEGSSSLSRPINIKKSFYWNEDKIKAGISVQGNWRNQNFPGTLPQRKNMVTGTFERDFDINPFSYALGMSRTLRPRNINVN